MTVRMRWLDTPDGPVAAAVATPRGRVTSGALIVPSIAHEANSMKPATIALALELADRGVYTVVLQLAGTDQSYGSLRMPGLVDRWRASVRRGLGELTAMGVEEPYLVACRLGATLFADAVDVGRLSGVVLWAPTTSGRRMVRELRLLQATGTYRGNAGDEVNVAGFGLNSELLDDISRLRLTADQLADVRRLLVVDDEQRAIEAPLLDFASSSPGVSTHVRVDDISRWIAVDPGEADMPSRSIATIAAWFPPGGEISILDDRATVTVAEHDGVKEELVSIGVPGLAGAFHQGCEDGRAALIVTSTSGPGRQFLELARTEARAGRTVLRFDLAGTGWSDPPLDRRPTFPHDERGTADVLAAARWLRNRTDAPIVGLGFCGGGRALIDAGAAAGLAAVVAVNVELFEPMRASRPRQPRPGGAVIKWLRRVGGGLRQRRATSRALRQSGPGFPKLLLVCEEAELSPTFLRTLRRGRAVLAGRDPWISMRIHHSLGHNLEGPNAGAALDDFASVLAEVDARVDTADTADTTPARWGRLVRNVWAVSVMVGVGVVAELDVSAGDDGLAYVAVGSDWSTGMGGCLVR